MSYIDDINDIWDLVREKLILDNPDGALSLWFSDLVVMSYENNCVTFGTESEFKHNIIVKRGYDTEIGEGFTDILGFPVTAKILFTGVHNDNEDLKKRINSWNNLDTRSQAEKDADKAKKEPYREAQKEPSAENNAEPKIGGEMPVCNFDYTFDNFIVGDSNKFAHAACYAVSQNPAKEYNYNPLFIYGPSGLGKTHLLYAITNEIRKREPDVKIIYVKGDEFTNQMIECLSRQTMNKFHDKYRNCDVLLIDDIQFIAGKVSTQEELFHTFNTLYEEHKQIILASDRPPHEINPLNERLKSRFEWGLLADIQPPDIVLRTAILKKKAEQVNIVIPDDALQFLAENLRSNIRQIEGAIKKLAALNFLSGLPVSLETAQGCIAELLGGEEPASVTVDKILSVVCKRYGVKREDVIGQKRNKEIAFARHVANYLIRDITEMSLPNVGKIFGRHYSTVISSIEFVEKRMKTDPTFEIDLKAIKKTITTMDLILTVEDVKNM